MAAYYLQMQPHLFRAAVESELHKLQEQREADAEAAAAAAAADAAAAPGAPSPSSSSSDLVLSRRMAEVRRAEQAVALEDLMYICILERFQEVGVALLPDVRAPVEESPAVLKSLTEGVHSREALEMVKEHVLGVLGPASVGFANTRIKMAKLQAAQVYAASIMFGYFLRRVDARFRLAKSLGVLPEEPAAAVARLERLFARADDAEASDADADGGGEAGPGAAPEQAAASAAAAAAASTSYGAAPPPDPSSGALVKRQKGALRRYVETFDQAAMIATARLVTSEGAALVERQTRALWGDVQALQAQMQEVVGQDAGSMEELMARVQRAVADDGVETVVVTAGTQRRAVLEAVAYGCFLRDVESWVDGEYAALLTPAPGAGAGGPGA
jgi:hypothetical protein